MQSRVVPSPQECQGRPRLLHPRPCRADSPPTVFAFLLQHVNFTNICFPWALAGLGWEGRVLLRIPEAALCFPLQQTGLPGVPAWQSLSVRPWELGSPPSPFPLEKPWLPAPHPTWKGRSEEPWGFTDLGLFFKDQGFLPQGHWAGTQQPWEAH